MKKYIIAMVAFVVGIVLVFGAVGADDFAVLVMHQEHALAYGQIIIGLLMCVPFPLMVEREYNGR